MRKQHFRLPLWRRKPTADEAAPDIADSELVPSESAAQPTRRKHGKRTYVIGGVLLALAIAAAVALPGAVDTDDGAGGASTTLARPDGDPSGQSAKTTFILRPASWIRRPTAPRQSGRRRRRSASSTTTRTCTTCAS